jgi:hypothetical protein
MPIKQNYLINSDGMFAVSWLDVPCLTAKEVAPFPNAVPAAPWPASAAPRFHLRAVAKANWALDVCPWSRCTLPYWPWLRFGRGRPVPFPRRRLQLRASLHRCRPGVEVSDKERDAEGEWANEG